MRILIFLIISLITTSVLADEYSANMLNRVNELRTSRGLKPYISDENLQKEAENITMQRASEGHKGHLRKNDWSYASAEGVGWYKGIDFTGVHFVTCYLYNKHYQKAGAALAVRDDGTTYYCLRLK